MTYQVLARKWRPKTFADLVGQQHVVKALQNALANGRLHHAYLLTGTRGGGKTTIARILAKSLNCENAQHGEPCGHCATCQAIDAGRFVDLLEIDAASNTGIDNIREVLENAQYAPTAGKYKVYIIDEVHMLSKSAFNAMLKTLEEPPEHVKFILATTDPHKVPITVLSRCLQFVLRNMTAQQVSEHLAHVLDVEQIAYEPAALTLLGRAAQGSMRDALSLLDQAIAMGSGSVAEADVRHMIGAVDNRYLFELLEILSQKNGAALIAKASEMHSQSLGFDSVLAELALLLQRIALLQTVPTAIAADDPEHDRLQALARAFNSEQIQLYYQCALHGKQDLPLAPDEYAGFVMTLLRMLAFAPFAAEDVPAHAVIENTQMHEPAASIGSLKTSNAGLHEAKTESADEVETSAANFGETQINNDTGLNETETVSPQAVAPSSNHAQTATPTEQPFSASLKTESSNEIHTNETTPEPQQIAPHPADITADTNSATAEPPMPETPAPADAQTGSPHTESRNEVQAADTQPQTPAATALSGSLKTSEAARPEPSEAIQSEAEPAQAENTPAPKKAARKKAAPSAASADLGSPKTEGFNEADTPYPPFAAENWPAIAERISNQISAARMLLDHTAWIAYQDGELHLAIVSEKTKNTSKKEYFNRIASALSEAYQIPVHIQTQPFAEGNGWETPAMHRSRIAAENRAQAQALMEQDPAVQAIQQHFGATWDAESIALNA